MILREDIPASASEAVDVESTLTPAQKAARTRAANRAKKAASAE